MTRSKIVESNRGLDRSHPMTSETDIRLIACVELMAHKGRFPFKPPSGFGCRLMADGRDCDLVVRVWETLHPLRGRIDTSIIDFIRRVHNDLLQWHNEWRAIHLRKHDENSIMVKLLDAELYYAQLWTACVALRGCHWEKLSLDQRELAFAAKDAALKCLATYKSDSMR